MTDEAPSIVEHGLLAMSDSAWDQAVRRAAVIAPLAARDVVGYEAADSAARVLGSAIPASIVPVSGSSKTTAEATAVSATPVALQIP